MIDREQLVHRALWEHMQGKRVKYRAGVEPHQMPELNKKQEQSKQKYYEINFKKEVQNIHFNY